MKKSALIALVGVALFILSNCYYLIVTYCVDSPWEHSWYDTMGKIFQITSFIGWFLVGQFFLTLYKKSK